MKVYFDLYDVPGHFLGWINGEIEPRVTPVVGAVVDLLPGPHPSELELKANGLLIEAVVPSIEDPAKPPQYKLNSITLTGAVEARNLIRALERTGRFLFWEFT